MIIFIIFVALLIIILFTYFGVKLCKENNALGLIPLFLGLSFIGILIGAAILYNNNNKKLDDNEKEIKEIIKENQE